MNQNIIRPFKFLVCVDNSDAARVAVRFAARRVQKRGGLVDLLHVMETGESPSLLLMANRVVESEHRAAGEALLKDMAEETQKFAVTPSLLLREGKKGEQILATVTGDSDINILVLGADAESSAGKSKLIPWLASQLSTTLLVPMMLVPGNLTDLQIEELT